MRKKIIIVMLSIVVFFSVIIFAVVPENPKFTCVYYVEDIASLFCFTGRDALLDYCDFMDKWGERESPFRDDALKMLFHDGYYLNPRVPGDWELTRVSCSQPWFLFEFIYKTSENATVTLKYSMDDVTQKNIKINGYDRAKSVDEYLKKRLLDFMPSNKQIEIIKNGAKYYYDKGYDELIWQQDGYFCALRISDASLNLSTYAGVAAFDKVTIKKENVDTSNTLPTWKANDQKNYTNISTVQPYIDKMQALPAFKGEHFRFAGENWVLNTNYLAFQSEHYVIKQSLDGLIVSVSKMLPKGQPVRELTAEQTQAEAKKQIKHYLYRVNPDTLNLLQVEAKSYAGKQYQKLMFSGRLNNDNVTQEFDITLVGGEMIHITMSNELQQKAYVKITEAQAKAIAYQKINANLKRLILNPWIHYQTDCQIRKAVCGNVLFYVIDVTEYNLLGTRTYKLRVNGLTGKVTFFIRDNEFIFCK